VYIYGSYRKIKAGVPFLDHSVVTPLTGSDHWSLNRRQHSTDRQTGVET